MGARASPRFLDEKTIRESDATSPNPQFAAVRSISAVLGCRGHAMSRIP